MGRWQDPHAALIERGHAHGMHVYASLRMNDQHLEPNPLASTGMTKLRAEHPHWQLGDKTSPFFASSWDMSVRGYAETTHRPTPRLSSSLTAPLAPCPVSAFAG